MTHTSLFSHDPQRHTQIKSFLDLKTTEEYHELFGGVADNGAFVFLLGCDIQELPKYINHPSQGIKDILSARLSGVAVPCGKISTYNPIYP